MKVKLPLQTIKSNRSTEDNYCCRNLDDLVETFFKLDLMPCYSSLETLFSDCNGHPENVHFPHATDPCKMCQCVKDYSSFVPVIKMTCVDRLDCGQYL